jgi:hypothetical protein
MVSQQLTRCHADSRAGCKSPPSPISLGNRSCVRVGKVPTTTDLEHPCESAHMAVSSAVSLRKVVALAAPAAVSAQGMQPARPPAAECGAQPDQQIVLQQRPVNASLTVAMCPALPPDMSTWTRPTRPRPSRPTAETGQKPEKSRQLRHSL